MILYRGWNSKRATQPSSAHGVLIGIARCWNFLFFLSNSVILPGCFLSLYIRLFFPCSLPPSFDFPSKISRSETRTSEADNFPEDKYHGCNSQVLVIACSMLLLSILRLYDWASLGMCRLVAHLSQKCPFFFLCFLSHGVQPRSRKIRGYVARM